ncbi:MAG: general secretion pathway protein GspK [Verrucomicrobiaceae bacterium]|nr:general secretion pathway protein GspK [Verrucomicrobiaceae bacterium]
MKHHLLATRSRHASVLLIVLAVIALLAFSVATTVLVSSQYNDALGTRAAVLKARRFAEMGISVAAHPAVSALDPLLEYHASDTEGYRAFMTSEEAKLNINQLLTDQRSLQLEQIFTAMRMRPGTAQGLVAALMDWVDPDSMKRRPDSAEATDYKQAGYPNRPFNRPFRSLDEMSMVAGIERLSEVCPDWRSLFTVYGSGQLDINEASADTIAMLTGAMPVMVGRLISRRDGRDGIHHTQDDQPVVSPQEALQMLGLPQNHPAASLLTIQGATLRIESIGWSGDQSIGVAVVTQKGGGQMRIQHREEFVPRRD